MYKTNTTSDNYDSITTIDILRIFIYLIFEHLLCFLVETIKLKQHTLQMFLSGILKEKKIHIYNIYTTTDSVFIIVLVFFFITVYLF